MRRARIHGRRTRERLASDSGRSCPGCSSRRERGRLPRHGPAGASGLPDERSRLHEGVAGPGLGTDGAVVAHETLPVPGSVLVGPAGLAPGGLVDEQAFLLALNTGVVDRTGVPVEQDLFAQLAFDAGVLRPPDQVVELQRIGRVSIPCFSKLFILALKCWK